MCSAFGRYIEALESRAMERATALMTELWILIAGETTKLHERQHRWETAVRGVAAAGAAAAADFPAADDDSEAGADGGEDDDSEEGADGGEDDDF